MNKKFIGALLAAGTFAGAAQAGEVVTRFVVRDDAGGVVSAGEDLVLDTEGAGSYTIALQASTNSPEGFGFAALRGRVNNSGFGAGESVSGATQAFGGTNAIDLNSPFATTQLQVVAASPGPSDPTANGQGAFIDILTFTFNYDGTFGEEFIFSFDPTDTPQGQPASLIITAWNQQPGGPIIPPNFFLYSPTTRSTTVNGSDLSIRFVPAPSALAVMGLGGLVATRRRR